MSASRREAAGGAATAADTFTAIAKAHRKLWRPHLTLHLCRAFEETTGSTLVPSTPEGLVLLLDAMQAKTVRHAVAAEGSGLSKGGVFGGEGAVKELLRRYEEGGKVRFGAPCVACFSKRRCQQHEGMKDLVRQASGGLALCCIPCSEASVRWDKNMCVCVLLPCNLA